MRVTRSILLLVGAMVAGVLGASFAHERRDSPATPPPTGSATSSSAKETLVAAVAGAKIAQLEARLAAVEGAGQGGDSKPTSSARAAPVDVAKLHTPEERERRIAADYFGHMQRIEQHKAEPRDEDWAPKMETNIAASLTSNEKGGSFKSERVDCRKSTCVANVSWPSRGSAEGELRNVVSSLIRTGCSREIFLPPASGSDGPTEGSVLLTCANAVTP